MSKLATIAEMGHRITVCTMQDIILDNGVMALRREGLFCGWAAVRTKRGSFFVKNGDAYKESRDRPSHEIVMNHQPDMDMSSSAWLYEERLQSPPRWYKVLDVEEGNEHAQTCFTVRLVERSDSATPPAPSVAPCDDKTGLFDPVAAPDWARG